MRMRCKEFLVGNYEPKSRENEEAAIAIEKKEADLHQRNDSNALQEAQKCWGGLPYSCYVPCWHDKSSKCMLYM